LLAPKTGLYLTAQIQCLDEIAASRQVPNLACGLRAVEELAALKVHDPGFPEF